MNQTLTKKAAIELFEQEVLPDVKRREKNGIDWAARREAWNNFTDELCKRGHITAAQYDEWSQPSCVSGTR